MNIQQLDALNLIRKKKTLLYQKTLNIRFREIVSSRDIPRLGTLLQICHNKGMGVQSIISRIGDAINSKYRVRKYGEDEWDIAYLVLRIGGPKLLHVLHATHGLPAPRSVQSHTRKDSYILAAVDTSFENRIMQNKNNGTFNETYDSIKILKMDEIATESRLRWCSKDNKIIGLCYQHSHDINISLNTLDDALEIKDLLDSDRIHKTK